MTITLLSRHVTFFSLLPQCNYRGLRKPFLCILSIFKKNSRANNMSKVPITFGLQFTRFVWCLVLLLDIAFCKFVNDTEIVVVKHLEERNFWKNSGKVRGLNICNQKLGAAPSLKIAYAVQFVLAILPWYSIWNCIHRSTCKSSKILNRQ